MHGLLTCSRTSAILLSTVQAWREGLLAAGMTNKLLRATRYQPTCMKCGTAVLLGRTAQQALPQMLAVHSRTACTLRMYLMTWRGRMMLQSCQSQTSSTTPLRVTCLLAFLFQAD